MSNKPSLLCAGMGWDDGRAVNGMYMFLAAFKWLRRAFPFWDRKNGTDHIIMATHDESSCWVPNELRSAILLTHWAPLDFPRTSKTAWTPDRYSERYAPLSCRLPSSPTKQGWHQVTV